MGSNTKLPKASQNGLKVVKTGHKSEGQYNNNDNNNNNNNEGQ